MPVTAPSFFDGDKMFRVDFKKHTRQTEVIRDHYAGREAAGGQIECNVDQVQIHDAGADRPWPSYEKNGTPQRINCDFIAGTNGGHRVNRRAIPPSAGREDETVYPFGLLAIPKRSALNLRQSASSSAVKSMISGSVARFRFNAKPYKRDTPVNPDLIYADSNRSFALSSMRDAALSRNFIQCSLSGSPDDWTDDALWKTLGHRIPAEQTARRIAGPFIENLIAPLRSFVPELAHWARLFLCSDAAHIEPPTGAKGLNTAASDGHHLHTGLRQLYADGITDGSDSYSQKRWRGFGAANRSVGAARG